MPWGRGSTYAWRVLRDATLARDPVCRLGYDCCMYWSTIADHIANVARGGVDELTNLQGVCSACHDVKTQRERTAGRWPVSRFREREQHPGA